MTVITPVTTQDTEGYQNDYAKLSGTSRMVLANSTITASGSSSVFAVPPGITQIQVLIDVTGTPTGTSPTLQFSLNQVFCDTTNPVTPNQLDTVKSYAGASITAAGTDAILTGNGNVESDYCTVSWAVTGTTPSFTGVYAKLIFKK